MDVDFTKLVEKHIFSQNIPRVRNLNKIGPSEISAHCVRKIVYSRDPEKLASSEFPYPDSMARFFMGHAMHEYFQNNIFPAMEGIRVDAVEPRIESEYIGGYIDLIISIQDPKAKDGWRQAVIELKTADHSKFVKMQSERNPLPEHREQITLYMGLTGIEEGYIFVIDKGFFEKQNPEDRALYGIEKGAPTPFIQFKIDFNEELYNSLIERGKSYVNAIREYRENGVVPDMPHKAGPFFFPCFWCQFRKTCWGEETYESLSLGSLNPHAMTDVQKRFENYIKTKKLLAKQTAEIEECEKQIRKLFYRHRSPRIVGQNFVADFMSGSVNIKTKRAFEENEEWFINSTREAMKNGSVMNVPATEAMPASVQKETEVKPIAQTKLTPNREIPASFEDYLAEFGKNIA